MDKETVGLASHGIYIIEDFISDKIKDDLLSYVNLDGDDGWNNYGMGQTECIDSQEEHMYELADTIENKVLDLFSNAKNLNTHSMRKIRKMKAGEFMHGHKDLGSSGGNFDIRFGVILYLNDDFEGGEIYYRDLDIKIKPKKNSLLVHKSTVFHEVLPVTSGTRYSVIAFIKGDDSTSFIPI